jgi:hypothetical protein
MVCPAISSYSFGATALIFCMMFMHIMEVGIICGEMGIILSRISLVAGAYKND